MADAPADCMATTLSNIVAFRITVIRVLAKAKLGRSREARDFAGAVERLRAAGQAGVAGEMNGIGPRRGS